MQKAAGKVQEVGPVRSPRMPVVALAEGEVATGQQRAHGGKLRGSQPLDAQQPIDRAGFGGVQKLADRIADACSPRFVIVAASINAGVGQRSFEPGKIFTKVPPRSRYPVAVTVAAWQWGRSMPPAVRTAETVKQTFMIVR